MIVEIIRLLIKIKWKLEESRIGKKEKNEMKYFHIVSILWNKDGMVERGAQTQAYTRLRERAVLGCQAFNKVMCSLNGKNATWPILHTKPKAIYSGS